MRKKCVFADSGERGKSTLKRPFLSAMIRDGCDSCGHPWKFATDGFTGSATFVQAIECRAPTLNGHCRSRRRTSQLTDIWRKSSLEARRQPVKKNAEFEWYRLSLGVDDVHRQRFSLEFFQNDNECARPPRSLHFVRHTRVTPRRGLPPAPQPLKCSRSASIEWELLPRLRASRTSNCSAPGLINSNAVVINQVGGRLRAAAGCEIFGARAGHDPDGAHACRNHGAGCERPYADCDIDAVLGHGAKSFALTGVVHIGALVSQLPRESIGCVLPTQVGMRRTPGALRTIRLRNLDKCVHCPISPT